jgi:hypothetical protein
MQRRRGRDTGEIPGKDPVYGYWADPGSGNLGRTPSIASLDLHADYPVTLAKSQLRISRTPWR